MLQAKSLYLLGLRMKSILHILLMLIVIPPLCEAATMPAGSQPAKPEGLSKNQWALAQAIVDFLPHSEAQLTEELGVLERMREGRVSPRESKGAVSTDASGRFVYSSAESKKGETAQKAEEVANIRKRIAALKAGGIDYPVTTLDKMSVGFAGKFTFDDDKSEPPTVTILQVVDGSNCLAKWGDLIFWISGISTVGVVDDKQVELKRCYVVTGTKTYANVAGSSRTVFVIEGVDEHGIEKAVKYLRSAPSEKTKE